MGVSHDPLCMTSSCLCSFAELVINHKVDYTSHNIQYAIDFVILKHIQSSQDIIKCIP